MTIFLVFLDSIDQATMTKQYENEVSLVAFEWCRYRSQSIVVLHFYSQLVLPPYTVKIRGDAWEGSSRWALLLPPNTIKIRGGRSSFATVKLVSCHPMQLRQGEDARPDTKRMSCHPTQSRQGEDARSSAKLMSCHPTQLRQGEDARHFTVSVKRMSYHPTQLR